MAYTDVFGGELLFPSQLSYLAITTAADITLQWPREQQIGGDNIVADFLDITTTVASLNIDMPSATVASTGNKTTFNNVGAESFTVRDNTGGTIQQVQPGEQWVLILGDNTTTAGTWVTYQLGASVAVAQASALAGDGIKAIGALLNQQIDSDIEAATPFTAVEGDRAKCLIYTAGAGTGNLPSAGTVGNDWFCMIRNSGTGTLNIVPPSGTVDGQASLNLQPNDSAFFFTDGTNFYTVGLSSGSTIAFDFVSIPVPGSGDFTLSGANLNRISYRFTGALTGNRKIVVPATTQQYWVDNQTTGAFTLSIGTAAQVTSPSLTQGDTAIFYCDSTDVVNAVSTTSITFPVLLSQGGTSATTAAGARTNLGTPGISGTPANNQIAVWIDAADVEGAADLTWDGVDLEMDNSGGALEHRVVTFNSVGGTAVRITTGGALSIDQVSSLGVLEDVWIAGARNAEVGLYYNGVLAFGTDTLGASVYPSDTATNPGFFLRDSGSTNRTRLYATASTTGIRGELDSMIIRMEGYDVGSVLTTLADFDPDGSIDLYHDGTLMASTLTAASGGFRVNNTSTGLGLERVLTTSDLVAGDLNFIKAATTNRNTDVTFTLDPDLQFTAASNTRYAFEAFLIFFSTSATPGAHFDFGGPSTADYIASWVADNISNTTTLFQSGGMGSGGGEGGNDNITMSANVSVAVHFRGVFEVSGTGGTLGVRWGQEVSNATNVGLLENSWLKVTEI